MKKKIITVITLSAFLGLVSCKEEFLNVAPTASLDQSQLANKKGVEGLLIGSYSALSGATTSWYGGSGNWLWGSITGGDANKGSNAGDQADAQPVSRYETIPTNGYIPNKWRASYEGISRANQTLVVLAKATDITDADKKRITGEARFLRGHFHFEAKKVFGNIPYIDETKDYGTGADKVSNTVSAWTGIEADFKYAMDNLPETQGEVGRANKWAAAAYLAKAYMYEKKYTEAKALYDQIIANGKTSDGKKYALTNKYTDLFNAATDNSAESIFAFQAAANTGSANNANYEFILNFPYNGGPAGCCGFFQPSFDLANSFVVDDNGLPLSDGSYRNAANELRTDQGLLSSAAFTPDAQKPVDPRLDYSLGRRGIPYLDWGKHPGNDWVRDQSYGGPFAPKKFVFPKAQQGTFTDGSTWTSGVTAINVCIIRYADVLLMAAEAEIEAGSVDKAREYVNMVRQRAANPAAFVMDGASPAANYKIGQYTTAWSDKDAARKAVRFERKIELSGEGHRMFDLVRWGVAATELNAFLSYEVTKLPNTYGGAKFTNGKNEYQPIPQSQIDIQGSDVLKQNPGY